MAEKKEMGKEKALAVIMTIVENMKDGVRKAALHSVAEWIKETAHDIPDDPEECERLAKQIEKELGLVRASAVAPEFPVMPEV